MPSATLRKVGGSVMLSLPPTILEALGVQAGTEVELEVNDRRLVVEASRRRKYSMEELLKQCDFTLPVSEEEREWLDSTPVGRELL